MGEDYDEFRQFNEPLESESQESGEAIQDRNIPELTPRGFFAPESEIIPSIEIEEEPARTRKILGGILSIAGGGFGMVIYGGGFLIGLLLSLPFLLSDAIAFIIMFCTLGIGVLGAILAFIGGIKGITSRTRRGDILAIIGNLIFLCDSILTYFFYTANSTLNQPFFLSITFIAIPCSIIGSIGALILWTAYRTAYYVE
ncbi:MAG: hypothetical protein ACTSRS_17915 [Candidatus Helarchaeota archaeon]